MTKEAEKAYLTNIGEAGRQHSLYKPFSDPNCGITLASIGIIMALLPPPPGRLLDLGCGGGWTSVFFALHGYAVTGQDIAPDMIELAIENRARNALDEDRLRFVCSDYEALDEEDVFDGAIFFDSLHHADDELLAIRSAYRALRPGGLLITHEPGEGHSIAAQSVVAMDSYGVNERDMPPSLIVRRGLEVGFTSHRVLPMPHDLFAMFYEPRKRPLEFWSWTSVKLMRRVLRSLFTPNMAAGSIVVLTK